MIWFGFKKLAFNLAVCLAVWWLARRYSALGPVYAGWIAGLLGFCYLLASWNAYLKSKGTALFSSFKRKKPPETPNLHRGSGQVPRRRWGWMGSGFPVEDSLEEELADAEDGVPPAARHRLNALVWLVAGFLMLFLSML